MTLEVHQYSKLHATAKSNIRVEGHRPCRAELTTPCQKVWLHGMTTMPVDHHLVTIWLHVRGKCKCKIPIYRVLFFMQAQKAPEPEHMVGQCCTTTRSSVAHGKRGRSMNLDFPDPESSELRTLRNENPKKAHREHPLRQGTSETRAYTGTILIGDDAGR